MRFLFVTDNLFMEQLGIMYVASTLSKTGVEVDLVKISDDLDQKVKEYSPDIIGYSVITGCQGKFIKINSQLKKKYKFKSVMGGPHATFFPEVVSDPGLDYVLRGEGERSVLEFIAFIKGEIKIEDVHNLSYKDSGEIQHNPFIGLVDNLDTLPFPNRQIFFKYPEIEKTPIKHFIASRGCPFGCSYCFNEEYYTLYKNLGKRVRFRSVANLISEIKEVIGLSEVKLVYFQDDTFILDKKWLTEFAKHYKREINLPYHCHVRANLVDEEIVRLLKSSNCLSVHIAIEAGNDYLRNQILKRSMKRSEILNACKLLKKYKIKFMLQNIIGLPDGNLQADLETLALNIKCSPTYSWVSIYQPYPGTPLAEYSIKKGFFNGNYDSLNDNFFETSFLNFEDSYKRQIENLQKVFAVIVAFPVLYYLKLYKILLLLPRFKPVKAFLRKIYLGFRKKADYKLFGMRV